MPAVSLALCVVWSLPAIEAQRLEGAWLLLIISQETNKKTEVVVKSPSGTSVLKSKPGPQPIPVEWTLTLSKRTWVLRLYGVEFLKGTFRVNPFATPTAIDLVVNHPDLKEPVTVKAIYKTEGATLTLCMTEAVLPRPKAFIADREGKNVLWTLKRQGRNPR